MVVYYFITSESHSRLIFEVRTIYILLCNIAGTFAQLHFSGRTLLLKRQDEQPGKGGAEGQAHVPPQGIVTKSKHLLNIVFAWTLTACVECCCISSLACIAPRMLLKSFTKTVSYSSTVVNFSSQKRVVTAYCGGAASTNGKTAVAQLTLNEDYEKVEKPGQKPKNMILLESVKIDCSYIPGSTVYSNPARMSASPSPSPHGSSQGGSGSGIISSGSGSGSGTIMPGNMYAFSIIAQNGDIHEFLSESENDRLRWVKLLQLLLMFPYSTIPDEPTNIPFKESMRANLEAKKYNAGRL